mmetsp:Transcript_25040/g.43236  ORF Transcript_25040/g.43236 Transcript_25040/m.43236 type:complete len:314 (-) Transcript_25040:684-1625(-)
MVRLQLEHEVHERVGRLPKVGQQEALVLPVGVAVRVLDAHEQRWDAAVRAGERLDKSYRAAAADIHGLLAVAPLQRSLCSFKGGTCRLAGPGFDHVHHRERYFRAVPHAPPQVVLELLRDLLGLLIRRYPAGYPGLGNRQDPVGRLRHRAGVDADHVDGGHEPRLLAGGEVVMPGDVHAGQHPGLLLEVRLCSSSVDLPQVLDLLLAQLPQAVQEPRHGDGAFLVVEGTEQVAQYRDCVEHWPSIHATVDRLGADLQLDVQIDDSAQRVRDGRDAHGQVGSVREDKHVGPQEVAVLGQVLGQMDRADLLLALE